MPFELQFRRPRGETVYRVKIKLPAGGATWISTGQTTLNAARQVCDDAKIAALQMAACANALTAEVITRLTIGKNLTGSDVVALWREESNHLAPETLEKYSAILKQFLVAAGCENRPLIIATRAHLDGFVNEERTTAALRRSRLAAARAFFTFAAAAGYATSNLGLRVHIRIRDLYITELEPKETVPISPAEFETLMGSPHCVGFYRWATALSYWLGLRLRDVACLEWESIRPETVLIYQKKTGGRLELPLADPLLGAGELAKILLEMRGQWSDARFCFPKQRALILDPRRRALLSVSYQRVLQRCGINGRRFHSLRHAQAMRLKVAGRTLEQIAASLGHAGTSATQTYTAHAQ